MKGALPIERWAVTVRGIVQGVGFRPFVYALAQQQALAGMVCNDGEGVRIEVEGDPGALDNFIRDLAERAPPLAQVDGVAWQRIAVRGDRDFHIEPSQESAHREALVAPDVATCAECLRELFDPTDRRYRYPFINCTNCGPRFSITRAVPYDRATTTMAAFAMCPDCRREYEDPGDRRFHAQPNACPRCGPHVRLLDGDGREMAAHENGAIAQATALLRQGAVVAVKGIGGYHLACDPANQHAVQALRDRKARQDKPFALMVRNLEQARTLCHVAQAEASLLTSPARPIVLLRRLDSTHTAFHIREEVAPRQRALGVMLAYTPLHYLLLHDLDGPLVMTSGNRSDEPIAYRDEDLFGHLEGIMDCALVHDRPIHMRCDDSVTRSLRGEPYSIRRSRGYAPAPVRLAAPARRQILACGGELKNTFCAVKGARAFMSHHIGDLENYETLRSFTQGIEHFCRLFDLAPELLAHDLHPDYLSTQYAVERAEEGVPAVGVQHHEAHIASCLADNGWPADQPVIGVAFDGTGYGRDGALWGGEFFQGSIGGGFARRAHLGYRPLPGGAAAIRNPWRAALPYLLDHYTLDDVLDLPLPMISAVPEREIRAVAQLARTGLNAPRTSSMGRLFDAVAALAGVPGSIRTTYEGQAAIELEACAAEPLEPAYPFALRPLGDGWVVDVRETVADVIGDLLGGRSAPEVAARFHRTAAGIVAEGCQAIRRQGGPDVVALSGGTFQNMLLLHQAIPLLENSGFRVLLHRRVPANDGGLSLGQAALAESAVLKGDG